jgi:hypothetical protein
LDAAKGRCPLYASAAQVTTIQGSATFSNLEVTEFTTVKRNRFIATVGGVAGVDPSFVQIISVVPGSVVVQWSVAVPKGFVVDTGDLSGQIFQRLTDDKEVEFGKVSIVSIYPSTSPRLFLSLTLPFRLACFSPTTCFRVAASTETSA